MAFRLRNASVRPLRLSPTTPKMRLTPAWASVSAMRSATLSIFMWHDPFSASGEHRRTFLEEGVAPLHCVGAETDFRLRFDLAAELIGIAGVFALVDQTARRDQRARRAACEFARQRKRAVAKCRIVEDFADQSPLFRLFGRERLVGHHQFERALAADEARQEPSRAEIGDQRDAAEHLNE